MPTILRLMGYVFSFYSNENNEPSHVHVKKGGAHGKVWVDPIEFEYMEGFSPREEKTILKITKENVELFKNEWNEFFGR